MKVASIVRMGIIKQHKLFIVLTPNAETSMDSAGTEADPDRIETVSISKCTENQVFTVEEVPFNTLSQKNRKYNCVYQGSRPSQRKKCALANTNACRQSEKTQAG